MRVVVLADATMEPLARHLPGHDVIIGGTGDLLTGLVDPAGPAADPATDLVVVCPDGDSTLPPLGAADLLPTLADQVDRFAANHPGAAVVATTMLGPARTPWAHADPAEPEGRFACRAAWESRLAELALRHANVHVCDLRGLAEEHGRAALVTDSYWYLGRIRLSPFGFELLADELLDLERGLTSQARKLLVLDLDNTLWGGVVGEDGMAGIALGEEGVGKCYRDFQRLLHSLRGAGTLLAVVSKNDAAIVDEVFERHPMMVLRPDDFVAVSADWTPKAGRIADLVADLDLGLDATVFIDDSPFEREQVRLALPAVAVPEFPSRPESLPSWLVEHVVPRHFPRARVHDTDRDKTGQYRARRQRRAAEVSDLEGFLDTLAIDLRFRVDDEALVPRMSQLTQKTNQFNLTTERLTMADVQRLVLSPDHALIACDYTDRFGDEGTIGVAVVDLAGGELANLLLSCRVLGRGVEHELLSEAEQYVAAQNHGHIRARYVPTPRNGVAAGFLESAGYRRCGASGGETWIGDKELT